MTSLAVNLFKASLVILAFSITFNSAIAGMIDKEGMAEWEICAMCHSLNGISRMAKFPKLAGQKSAYISKQFMDFYNGRRSNDGGQMEAITTEVDIASVDSIANYFSQLPPPAAAELESDAESLRLFSEGEKLFYHGGKNTPACANCHDRSVDSKQQKIAESDMDLSQLAPWLFGQHESYLVKQLEDFKSGNRANDTSQTMHQVAVDLTPKKMRAVAFYLAHNQPIKGAK